MVQLIERDGVYTTWQAYSDDKDRRDFTRVRTKTAKMVLDFLKTKLDLPKDLKVIIGYTRAKSNNGIYFGDSKQAWIDPRIIGDRKFIDTICHELVHAEQYNTGMLKQERVNGKWVARWNDQQMKRVDPSSNYKRYLDLPWEVDARTRAAVLTREFNEQNVFKD